jgi:sporulation protein YlmC with PRC-barrel domain
MRKLYSLAFYALITPAISLGSGALLAAQGSSENPDLGEQDMGQDAAPETQNPEEENETIKSKYNTAGPTEQKPGDQSGMHNKGLMDSPPANGVAASDLIGTDLKTSGDESVGEIGDLIIDQDGKVVAVVVNVGGYLGMGEKYVIIDWNAVKMSGNADARDLRVDMTRDDLQSAPSYEKPND